MVPVLTTQNVNAFKALNELLEEFGEINTPIQRHLLATRNNLLFFPDSIIS